MPAEAITTGILFGFTLSFSAGPVMFALIQTSIREGFFRALLMEIGIVLSDALFIIVAFYSLGQLIHENPLAQDIIITSGGMLLIGIGMFKFLHKPHMR